MAEAIVGRAAELRTVLDLLEDESRAMRALVLEGEVGIGKTTLWRDGVDRARARLLATLTAQPAQAESLLPFAALGDLLAPVLDERLPALPPPLRSVLEVALQRRAAEEPAEQLAVSRATLELLTVDGNPLLLAVDDVQWLDPPSERTLEFVLRRLPNAPIRLLLARRSEVELPPPLSLERALPYERLHSRRLGPMTLGELEEARSLAESAHRVGEERGHRGIAIRSAGVLGLVELQSADAERALVWLTPAREELQRMGMGELSISAVVQNEIEALVAVGRLDEADQAIAFVEEKGRPAARSWHKVVAQRGRALVASARGDFDRARVHLDEALTTHVGLLQPFELGRTLLAQGSIERRAKHRADARKSLTRSLELFDELGAALWAEKAAAELARIPGRGRASSELTETERRVAELVAEGLSNKEVAARLFVTVRTVEANLTKVYGKLGVRSRTELAGRLRS